MTATAPALVGGAIAASTKIDLIGVTLSFISHPLLDMIPHWDFGIGWRKKNRLTFLAESGFDLILGIVLSYFLFGRSVEPFYFLACIFASEFWDLMMMPYLLWGWKKPFSTVYSIQSKMQANTKTAFAGILTQVGTVAGLVLAIRILH